jgi:hypothetical protein
VTQAWPLSKAVAGRHNRETLDESGSLLRQRLFVHEFLGKPLERGREFGRGPTVCSISFRESSLLFETRLTSRVAFSSSSSFWSSRVFSLANRNAESSGVVTRKIWFASRITASEVSSRVSGKSALMTE